MAVCIQACFARFKLFSLSSSKQLWTTFASCFSEYGPGAIVKTCKHQKINRLLIKSYVVLYDFLQHASSYAQLNALQRKNRTSCCLRTDSLCSCGFGEKSSLRELLQQSLNSCSYSACFHCNLRRTQKRRVFLSVIHIQ